jgi:hypothetical protein
MRRLVKAEPGHDCPLCIDGFSPCCVHAILGPVMHACTALPPCYGCGGALFPTDGTTIDEFARRMDARGFYVDFCMVCLGVIEVLPMTGDSR